MLAELEGGKSLVGFFFLNKEAFLLAVLNVNNGCKIAIVSVVLMSQS